MSYLRRKIKRVLLCFLSVLIVLSFVIPGNLVVNALGAIPSATNLKLNLLEEPYGITKDNLAFSWAMDDSDYDEYQTEYRLFIDTTYNDAANGEGSVYDSNWVESSQSSGIILNNLNLNANSLYYWSVQIKDKDGNSSNVSKPQAFVTAPEIGDGWQSISGIWDNTSSRTNEYVDLFREKGWNNYTVEMDVKTSTALGIAFYGTNDGSSSYFWQFRGNNNQVIPHYVTGTAASYNQTTSLNDYNVKPINGNDFTRIKLEINNNTVNTYIENKNDDGMTLVNTFNVDKGFTYGSIGFRTGNYESGYVDNIEVYKIDGNGNKNTLFSTDFENGNKFSTGTVENGVLSIPNGIPIPSLLSATSAYPNEANSDKYAAKGDFIFARSEFGVNTSKKIAKVMASVTAKSPEPSRQFVFDLYVNGHSVGVGPSRYDTDPNTGTGVLYFNNYDITEYLTENGQNAIGAICYTTSEKSFLCQVTAFYTDGTKEILTNSGNSDSGWKTKDGTNAFGDGSRSIGTSYFNAAAQDINMCAYPEGFSTTEFEEDYTWLTPTYQTNIVSGYTLSPYPGEATSRYEIEPSKVTNKGNGTYIIDLGQEIIGSFSLKDITVASASDIEIRYGEELNSDGSVRYQMRTGNNYLEKWTLKEGTQTAANNGMMAYRYVEVRNCPIELTTSNVRGIAIRQEFDENESVFTSSSKLLNDIYRVTKNTIKYTNQDLMVDSQSRERAAYEGDVVINALSSYAFIDDYSLARFTNNWLITHRTWPVEYVLFTVINAWNDYLYTGDKTALETYYDTLGSSEYGRESLFTNLLGSNNLLAIPTFGQNTTNAVLVDWPVSETDGYDRKEYNTVMNAVAVGAYSRMADIANAVGKSSDAAYWNNLASKIKSAMISNLYDSTKGAFRDGVGSTHYSQHATAYALAFDIYTDMDMAKKMAEYIASQGEIKTSVYGSLFLLQGLYNANAGDTAMDLLTSTGTRSWYHMIYDLGATLTTEAWDPGNKNNMTFSHAWGSAAASQIVSGMFGIEPTSPGFESFNMNIRPGDISSASIAVPTVKGTIIASYNLTDTKLQGSFHVPANTTSTITLPIPANLEEPVLYINNRAIPIKQTVARAVAPVTTEYTLTLGAGDYEIAIAAAGDNEGGTTTPDTPVDPTNGKWVSTFTFDDTETGFTTSYAKAENSTTSTLVDSNDGKAVQLDGNFLTITDLNGDPLLTGLEEMTISIDAYVDRTETSWLFYAAPSGNSQGYLWEEYLGILTNGGNVTAERYDNEGSRPNNPSASFPMSEWHNVTIVCSEGETNLYIDGVLRSTVSSEVSLTEMLRESSILLVGKANWGSGEFADVLVDNLTIANYAFSSAEVDALVNGKEDIEFSDEYVYFDNALTHLTDAEGIYYSVDNGITWLPMDKVEEDSSYAPEGENVCFESLWRAKLPVGATSIKFRGHYNFKPDARNSSTAYPAGIYQTANYNLEALKDDQNCFYGAPMVAEFSKGITIGGTWDNVADINEVGTNSNDIPTGNYEKDASKYYYATSTFYDFYTDYELWGALLKDSTQGTVETQYGDQPNYAWNLAISEYYKNAGETGVYPLYFGGARVFVAQPDLVDLLHNYKDQIQFGNGYATVTLNGSSVSKNTNGNQAYFPNQGLLNEDPMFTDLPVVEENGNFKNIYLLNSEVPTPYFNEEFLLGDNVYKTKLGEIYKNVDFPFVQDENTGYWVFDSSKEEYNVRMKQDEDGTYFLERVGDPAYTGTDKGDVNYENRSFFFPFTNPGDYSDTGAPGASTSNLNYSFSSVIEIPFSLTSDRKIVTNGNEHNTVFTFSGDDDVWVVLEAPDGSQKLVLDIGGSHGAVSGAIDFTTGQAAISGQWSYLENDRTAIAMDKDEFINLAEQNGVQHLYNNYGGYIDEISLNDLGIDVTQYEPYKEYKLQIYYMERGNDQSNLRVSFNFAHEKRVIVEKDWSDGNDNHEPDPVDITLYQRYRNENAVLVENNHVGKLEVAKDANGKYIGVEYDQSGHPIYHTITLQKDNNWMGGWTELFNDSAHNYSYYLSEAEVKNGYIAKYYDSLGNEMPIVELTVGGQKVNAVLTEEVFAQILIKNYRLANLIIKKTDNRPDLDEGQPLSNVQFELYKANVTQNDNHDFVWSKAEQTPLHTAVTDVNGIIRFDGLIEGKYLLYEFSNNENYIIPVNPWHVSVSGDGTITITEADGRVVPVVKDTEENQDNFGVENHVNIKNNPSALEIIKKDKWESDVLLPGVEFTLETLLSVDEQGNETYGNPVTYITGTNAEQSDYGKVLIRGLELGKYRLTEVKAAEGYQLLAAPIIIEVTEDGMMVNNDPLPVTQSEVDESIYSYKLIVLNQQDFEFPATGGTGFVYLIYIGFIIAWVGTIKLRWYAFQKKRGERTAK